MSTATTTRVSGEQSWPRRHRVWAGVVVSVLMVAVLLAVVVMVVLQRASPILKKRVIETLSAKFEGRVELDQFQVSALHGLSVEGGGLRVYAPAEVVAAGMTKPVITVEHFDFHVGVLGLLRARTHVGEVRVRGLDLEVPPREWWRQETRRPKKKIEIVVDRIVCDDSRLVINTVRPGKDPKVFVLQHIVLQDVGPDQPWRYDATLVNAVPRGDIEAHGTFGPWMPADPGAGAVTGRYVFDHADLNTIKGIGGMLHSVGTFRGVLDRIEVEGRADVPNLSLDTANHPVPLETRFHAIVDGTSGDTTLQPVIARLGETEFTCRGAVVNHKGVGHAIDLDVDVPNGRLEDFLRLSVKTEPVVVTGRIQMKTKLHIAAGKESVPEKLQMKGEFTLRAIHFTNGQVQDKVDMLSLRAQGEPGEAKPGATDVDSRMEGQFTMGAAKLHLAALRYELPGASVELGGVYSLDGNQFDFSGKVRTKAKISQMVASRWKSLLLKPVDPFFAKQGAGAVIPVKISGTRSAPKFGLNLF